MITQTRQFSNKRTFSFRKGYEQLTIKQTALVRDEIMNQLNWSYDTFYRRLRGSVEPKVTEAETIEKAFSKFGVIDIWE